MPAGIALALAALRGGLSTLAGLWSALPTPVKVVLAIGAAFLIGFWRGGVEADRRCEARIEASIKAAKTFDEHAAAVALARAAEQAKAADERADADKREIKSYAEQVAQSVAASCRIGDDADRNNDGLGVQDDGIQPARPRIAPGGIHRAKPRVMPPGTEK